MTLPERPREVDSPDDLAKALAELRTEQMRMTVPNWELIVLYSHVIAWLSWCEEAVKR